MTHIIVRESLQPITLNTSDVVLDHKDEKDILGVDGVMQYLQDLGVNLETAEIFVPLEIVQAPGLGEIARSGFVNGWSTIG